METVCKPASAINSFSRVLRSLVVIISCACRATHLLKIRDCRLLAADVSARSSPSRSDLLLLLTTKSPPPSLSSSSSSFLGELHDSNDIQSSNCPLINSSNPLSKSPSLSYSEHASVVLSGFCNRCNRTSVIFSILTYPPHLNSPKFTNSKPHAPKFRSVNQEFI
ncbi:hypothetical protein Hanom_Chr08g00700721 [Helianthus anomalus]